jgi:GNAT superfamily N-acetyltransferase
MPPEFTLRSAVRSDASAIAALSGQLGYPASSDEVARRLDRILDDPDSRVIVAELSGAGPVGWIHADVVSRLTADPFAEIGGVVVAHGHRGEGIGRELLVAAEEWAAERGCRTVRIRSDVKRERSHRFFTDLGYGRSKTQHVFDRSIEEPASELDDEMLPVLKTTDPALLPVVRTMLEASGVPHVIQGEAGIGLFPLGAAGTRVTGRATGAIILVPRSRFDEARALLETEAADDD